MDWLQVFVNLVLTGILLYIFQRVIDERSERRLEKFKVELRSTAFEREIKFSKLHEKRVEALAEIHKKLFRMSGILSSLKLIVEFDKSEKSDRSDEDVQKISNDFHEVIKDFYAYYEENRLYLPDHLCKKLYTYWMYSTGVWANLSTAYITLDYSERTDEDKEAYIEDARESLLNASSKIKDVLDPLEKEIEKEFRNLIGSA